MFLWFLSPKAKASVRNKTKIKTTAKVKKNTKVTTKSKSTSAKDWEGDLQSEHIKLP